MSINDTSKTQQDTSPAADPAQLSARLDRLPFSRKHGKVLFGSGIGWAFDAMDVGLISFVIVALSAETGWAITGGESSWIVSAGFVGMALGATLGGLLADRIGRKNVFALTLLIYGLATGASALATSVGLLIVLRVIVGFGLGAELPVASTLVSELSPKRIRGRIVVWLEGFWALGWIAAAFIGTYVVPMGDNGWRWAFLIGAAPALYAVVIRRGIPESVRYLISKGRVAEAEEVVKSFEASSGLTPEQNIAALEAEQSEQPAAAASTERAPRVAALFSSQLRGRTVGIWITWFMINFSYYGAFIWIPSILFDGGNGFTIVKSFQFTLIITLAQIPGYAASAWLIEKWGRRPTLATFLIGSAVSAVLFGTATTDTSILLAGCLLSFFNLGAWGALYALTPELYPTWLRGTGSGWAAGFGRIASIVTPLLVPVILGAEGLLGLSGKGLLFVIFSAAFAIAAIAVFTLPEKRGQALED